MLSVLRFLAAYQQDDRAAVLEEEVTLGRDRTVPATLLRPRNRSDVPGWIVLHGITVPGRRHPSLVRFARALSASGSVVLLPEIEAWAALRIDPDSAAQTLTAATRYLRDHPDVAPGGAGVIGFSFGATQALITAADPQISDSVRAVVGFGGYCDLRRTLRFMLTGVHEWEGTSYRLDPDPYGRWIIAANYLTGVPEYRTMEAVARGARELAAEAGRRGVYAADAMYDEAKAAIRATLTPRERAVWDLIAPPTGTRVHTEAARDLAGRLVEAALTAHPQLDPGPFLPRLQSPVVLAHGYDDRLIPFSETLRLERALPPTLETRATLTRLFAHSKGVDGLRIWEYPRELVRYARLLRHALGS